LHGWDDDGQHEESGLECTRLQEASGRTDTSVPAVRMRKTKRIMHDKQIAYHATSMHMKKSIQDFANVYSFIHINTCMYVRFLRMRLYAFMRECLCTYSRIPAK